MTDNTQTLNDLLDAPTLDNDAVETLWYLIATAFEEDQAHYTEHMLPILLEHQDKLCAHTLAQYTEFEEIEYASTILPLPCFSLEIPFDFVDQDGVEALANNPLLGFVNHLEIQGEEDEEPGAEGVRTLLNSEHFSDRMRHLDIIRFNMGDEGVKLLCESPKCHRIKTLNLSENQITDEGMSHFANTTLLANLEQLTMWDNDIQREGVQCLQTAHALTKLDLSSNPLGDAGVGALSSIISQLTHLDLRNVQVKDDGLVEFATNSDLSKLEYLVLECNDIGDRGLTGLATGTNLSSLDYLTLEVNEIGAHGMAALAQNTTFSPSTGLLLNANNISNDGLIALTKGNTMARLERLVIDNNQITAEGVVEFAQSGTFEALEDLSLEHNELGDEALKAIVDNASNFPNVYFINLNSTGITSESLCHLTESTFSLQLESLYIEDNDGIDEAGWIALLESPYVTEYVKACYEDIFDRD